MKEKESVDYYFTGLSGGARYEPVVRYNKTTVYIPFEKIGKAMRFLKCKEVDSGANIAILPLYEDVYTYDCRIINNSSVVSPVQAYLDCMKIKGRGEEMAREILKKDILDE